MVLICEVEESGDVETELGDVLEEEQHQTHAVQTKTGAQTVLFTFILFCFFSWKYFGLWDCLLEHIRCQDVQQIQADVLQLTRDLLLVSDPTHARLLCSRQKFPTMF